MEMEKKLAGSTAVMFASTQTLVVGTGAAGLNAAVSLVKEGVRDVVILTEGKMMGTSRNTGSDKQTYIRPSSIWPQRISADGTVRPSSVCKWPLHISAVR